MVVFGRLGQQKVVFSQRTATFGASSEHYSSKRLCLVSEHYVIDERRLRSVREWPHEHRFDRCSLLCIQLITCRMVLTREVTKAAETT